MNICDILTVESIRVPLEGDSQSGILNAILDCAAAGGKITDREAALEAILKRESLASTAMDHGVAVPHARSSAVTGLVFALGVSKQGVDFGSPDGRASRIFFFFITPEVSAGSTVQLLARIAQVGSDARVRSDLLSATNAVQALEILRAKERTLPA
jgi:mannitol/fructose-specific phosphotransferase system IIA component (Ntr-type)